MHNQATTGNPAVKLRHRLRIAREHAGLDQTSLAELMGVSRGTVSNGENGSKVRPITIKAWALACGVSAEWLLSGDDRDEASA